MNGENVDSRFNSQRDVAEEKRRETPVLCGTRAGQFEQDENRYRGSIPRWCIIDSEGSFFGLRE
jgi:hypothetical protein